MPQTLVAPFLERLRQENTIEFFGSSSEMASVAVGGREATDNVVWLRGEYDFSTVTALTQTIAGAITLDEARLMIDLSGVQFVDAATNGVIFGAENNLLPQSRLLTIRFPSRPARRVLDIRDLTDFLVDQTTVGTIDLAGDQQ